MYEEYSASRTRRTVTATARLLRALHLDGMLLAAIAAVSVFGLFVLYSAAGDNTALWFSQLARFGIGIAVMVALAQVPDHFLRMLSPALYVAGFLLLVAVEVAGDVGKGAQRWLDLGVLRFQPSEIMKLGLVLALQGCSATPWLARRSAGPTGLLGEQMDRQDPALSGNGQWLASLVSREGTPEVLLQEQPSGRMLPLPQLERLQPHRSPSLSWNGRYLALLVQQGDRAQPVLLDRLNGQLRRLITPPGLEPERLSLSPDGQRLALQLVKQGRSEVQLFDLASLVEPDRPPGQLVRGGGAP